MKTIKTKLWLSLLFLFIAAVGCGNDPSEVGFKKGRIDSNNSLRVQIDAVKQAKEVEQLVQEKAAQHRQVIEDQLNR